MRSSSGRKSRGWIDTVESIRTANTVLLTLETDWLETDDLQRIGFKRIGPVPLGIAALGLGVLPALDVRERLDQTDGITFRVADHRETVAIDGRGIDEARAAGRDRFVDRGG